MADAAAHEPVAEAEEEAAPVKLPSLETRVDWVDDWDEKTTKARELARRDRDYRDNKQWTKEEIDELEKRGQPVLTKNYVAPKVNFIVGEEIKKRVDPVARPRTPQHEDAARAATDALRFVDDEQQFDDVRSAVASNLLVEGIGGALKGMEEGPDGRPRHTLTHIEYDRLIWDPYSRAGDFGDKRFGGVILWMDIDDAIAGHPDAADALRKIVNEASILPDNDSTGDVPRGWVDRRRERVKLVELYFRVGQDWYRSVFTERLDIVEPEKTFLLDEHKKHSVCPLVMASCYVDAEGNRYGIVRQLISPQDEVNKRASKSLHLISVNQVLREEGAVLDPEKFHREAAKPDGDMVVQPDALNENRIVIKNGVELAAAQVQLLQDAKADIHGIGPSAAQIPDMPESSSGRALIARQQAAAQELGGFFDSLRRFTLAVYTLDWLAVRQYWTDEVWLRVTDDQELNGYRFVALNRRITRGQRLQDLIQKGANPDKAAEIALGTLAPIVLGDVQRQHQRMTQQAQMMGQPMPEGPELQAHMQQMVMAHPAMQEKITENQVDQMQVDIVLDIAPDTAVIEQEEFSKLAEIVPTIVQVRPDLAPSLARALIKASQLRDKRELLQEMDKGPDPQAAQLQQTLQQIQLQGAKAGVEVQQSQAHLNHAKAAQAEAQAEVEAPKAAAEIDAKKAQAMSHAASAGAKTGSTAPMPMPAAPQQQQQPMRPMMPQSRDMPPEGMGMMGEGGGMGGGGMMGGGMKGMM